MNDGLLGERRVTAVDGRLIATASWGDPAGRPVIGLHATPGSRLGRHPDPAVYLRHRIRMITLDRPGYGASSRRPRRRVADAASDVAAVADAYGLRRVGLLGLSGGAPHALACAALIPQRISAVLTVVPVAPFDVMGRAAWLAGMAPSNIEEFTTALRGEVALTELVHRTIDRMSTDVFDLLAGELHDSDRQVTAEPDVRRMLTEQLREAFAQRGAGWVDDDLAFCSPWGFELADITLPVGIFAAREDTLTPFAHADYLATHLRTAQLLPMDGAGHLAAVRFADAQFDWLGEHLETPVPG